MLIKKFKKIATVFLRRKKKRKIINRLLKISPSPTIKFNSIWPIETPKKSILKKYSNKIQVHNKIMGHRVDLDNIDWHKDSIAKFKYPILRFDQIKIRKYFNKGNDINFVWKLSCFYFGVNIAQKYQLVKKEKYYFQFKNLILDWIDKNPFLYGVNWICTMEVAIRAINIIVALNLFRYIFYKDKKFQNIIIKSLIQHAEYISEFPEKDNYGNSTNHLIADYAGLLFLALTLKDYPKSKNWLLQAKDGLIKCIDYQIYDDGVDYEGSIPYHRLVLELFGYSAVVCRKNNVYLPSQYYEKLFKMFEYTAAYVDHNGNAPQVGDNDSGRVLIFHKSEEHDHSYLLVLGEHIFNYKYKSQCKNRDYNYKQFLPVLQKINLNEIKVSPRPTDQSIIFEKGGAYILKNKNFSMFVSLFPLGQNGIGGHNHIDVGSFTLSYKGIPFIVDSGTYSYTRNINERNRFRSINYHNGIISCDLKNKLKEKNIWQLNYDFFIKKIIIEKNKIYLHYILFNMNIERLISMDNYNLVIHDKIHNSKFTNQFHFHPSLKIKSISDSKARILSDEKTFFVDLLGKNHQIESYFYSPSYGQKRKALKIVFNSNKEALFKLIFTKTYK